MVIITMILLIRWTIISPAFQGRLLFPALIGVNLLWVLGLRTISGRWSLTTQTLPAVPLFATLFLLIMAIIIPFTHIAPAYAYPQPVAVPEWAEFGPITYTDSNGESISLVGVEMEPGQTAVPNDQVGIKITLYWTTQTGVSTDYVTSVHALGRGYESIGQVDRHPGWGMWPPTRWQPGEIYADPYHVWINPGNPSPSLLRMDISVSDTSGPESRLLTATDPAGAPLDLAIVGKAKLGQSPDLDIERILWNANAIPVMVDFADFVTLEAVSPLPEKASAGDDLPITLYWRANGTPSADYTVFLQLIDKDISLAATGDQPPLNGDYPTPLWSAGELIEDHKILKIPANVKPGPYQILIGMYDPITGNRMQRLDGGDSVTHFIEIIP